MDSKKLLAAAVVAMFCITAYAVIDTGDASDAASKKYELYVEILGDDHTVEDYAYVYFESDADNEKYCKAANDALSKAGYGDVTFTYSEEYGISVAYKGDIYNACYYSDKTSWVAITDTAVDYINNAKAGLAVNGGSITEDVYDSLPEYEKENWVDIGWGYYQKLLEAPGTIGEVKNYFAYLCIIDDDLVSVEIQTIEFSAENNESAWIFGFNQATKALGNSIFSKVKASKSFWGGVSIDYAGISSTASWVKENSKWVSVTDTGKQYVSGNSLDFELKNGWISEDQYNKLSDDQKAFWVKDSSAMGTWYQRMASGELVDDVLDVMLIVGIVIIVIIVILVVFLIFRSKKKSSA